jgi:hypothetical protein
VPPAHWAIAEPLPDITHSNIEEEDLDGNKEVLGPLLDENGDGRQAAKQECKDEDNWFIAFNAPTATDKDRDVSNLGDPSNWISTVGKSSAKEDQNSSNSVIDSVTSSKGNRD